MTTMTPKRANDREDSMLDTVSESREMAKVEPGLRAIIDKYSSNIPVRLGAMAEELGIRVLLSSLPTGISGLIQRVDDRYEIKINRHESKERQRFTLAHEISHFLLHRPFIDSSADGIRDNVLYRSGAPASIEYEANRLAADLVMPPEALERETRAIDYEMTEEALEALARRFGVSKAAIEIRVSGR